MQCIHMLPNGRQCLVWALADSDRCFWHDDRPEIVAKRLAAQKRGGRGRKPKQTDLPPVLFDLEDLSQVTRVVSKALHLRLSGMLSHKDCQQVFAAVDRAMKGHTLLSVDKKTDELLRLVRAERNRPVDSAAAEELLRFAQDDAEEIAQTIADADDAGQQNGDSVAGQNSGGPAHQPIGQDAGRQAGEGDADVDKVGGRHGEPTR